MVNPVDQNRVDMIFSSKKMDNFRNVICGSLIETPPSFDKERWYAFNH